MIHIIFHSEFNNDEQPFIKSLPKKVRENCIEISSPMQFRTLLGILEPNIELMIWVHIGSILASKLALSGMIVEYAKDAEEFLDENKIEYRKLTRGSEIATKQKDTVYTAYMLDMSSTFKKYIVSELRQILSINPGDVRDGSGVNSNLEIFDENQKFPRFKYAVITALYDDEFKELERIFEFPKDEFIRTNNKVFYKGYFKKDKSIEIIAAVPNSTGMLDSSILATLMLEHFKPDYLFMSGVCGGSDKTNFGDIVLAKQIFTFQKGKISDLNTKKIDGTFEKLTLYDNNNQPIDYNRLYDHKGKQINVNIEKFEIEHDSIIQLDSLFEDILNPELDNIKQTLNRKIKKEHFFENKSIEIFIEPMACSTMIINKVGYFEDTIKFVHRKTAAVEMESYGVARACLYANNGKTKPIIFKSVMDKTVNKEDSVQGIDIKKFAAFTSAQFLGLLFEYKII